MDIFEVYTQKDDSVNRSEIETLVAPTFLEATEWDEAHIQSLREMARFGSKPFNGQNVRSWPKGIRREFERARSRLRKAQQRCSDITNAAGDLDAVRQIASQKWDEASELASRLKIAERRWRLFLRTPASDRRAGLHSNIAREIWEGASEIDRQEHVERRRRAKALKKIANAPQPYDCRHNAGDTTYPYIFGGNTDTISAEAGERLIADRRLTRGAWCAQDIAKAIERDLSLTRLKLMPFQVTETHNGAFGAQHDEGVTSDRAKKQTRREPSKSEDTARHLERAQQIVVKLEECLREIQMHGADRAALRKTNRALDKARVELKVARAMNARAGALEAEWERWNDKLSSRGISSGLGLHYASDVSPKVTSKAGPIDRPCDKFKARTPVPVPVPLRHLQEEPEDQGQHHVIRYRRHARNELLRKIECAGAEREADRRRKRWAHIRQERERIKVELDAAENEHARRRLRRVLEQPIGNVVVVPVESASDAVALANARYEARRNEWRAEQRKLPKREGRSSPQTNYRTREEVDALFSETEQIGFLQWFNRNRQPKRNLT